jgi:hypothetical protein
MDSLFFLIVFIFPGVFIRMAYDRINPSIQDDKSKYNETVHAFIISTVILLVNTVIIKLLCGINIMSWYALREYIEIPNNFIVFFSITSILIIPGIPIYKWIIDSVVIKAINPFREGKAKESSHKSPWHAVFENEEFSLVHRPVGIFKGRELVTIGYVCYSAPDKKVREFKLNSTDFMKVLYSEDPAREEKDKLFNLSDAEYYDPQLDMLIKFYNNENYLKYLEDNNLITLAV